MRKLIATLLIFVTLLSLTGCGYEETKMYDIISSRVWIQQTESGTFTTKKDTTTYIEIIYKKDDCFVKVNKIPNSIIIGNTTWVVEEKGDLYPTFYMTLDYYNQLFKEASDE